MVSRKLKQKMNEIAKKRKKGEITAKEREKMEKELKKKIQQEKAKKEYKGDKVEGEYFIKQKIKQDLEKGGKEAQKRIRQLKRRLEEKGKLEEAKEIEIKAREGKTEEIADKLVGTISKKEKRKIGKRQREGEQEKVTKGMEMFNKGRKLTDRGSKEYVKRFQNQMKHLKEKEAKGEISTREYNEKRGELERKIQEERKKRKEPVNRKSPKWVKKQEKRMKEEKERKEKEKKRKEEKPGFFRRIKKRIFG